MAIVGDRKLERERRRTRAFLRPVAPSTFAASSTSFGIDASPAIMITVANGSSRQACTVVIAAQGLVRLTEPVRGVELVNEVEPNLSVQFTTEKSESKIQREADRGPARRAQPREAR